MAVEMPARRRRELPSPASVALAEIASTVAVPRTEARPLTDRRDWSPLAVRLLEILPGAAALLLISTLVWGYVWFPTELAVGLILFDVYWLWKSWTIAYHVVKGVRLIKHFQQRDWREEHRVMTILSKDVLPWDAVRHVVIIPNYKESTEKLRATLRAMAQADGARQSIIPVLAMETTEGDDARLRAETLEADFQDCFYDLLITYHPADLPGEVRGKSSNEAWAARRAVEDLVDERGMNMDHLTVTSCDADTLFPRQYFECLTFCFATDPKRYRRFWQAPIFFYNNIWQVPAALRVPNALGGLVHLSRLSRRRRILFSQSTYSLSMTMAHDVGYWDTDVIPEDWHMFLKCFYALGGSVDVRPIHLPLGNDGALSRTPRATFVNQYLQVRRWAWGAVDVPYAVMQAIHRKEIPLHKRLLRVWYFFENHLMWSTQWFFITLGGLIPFLYDEITGVAIMPGWFTWSSRLILLPCLFMYFVLIDMDRRMRPAPPSSVSLPRRLLSYIYWLAISPITFLFSALPALDSQVRLMLGRRMEYRVTEKV